MASTEKERHQMPSVTENTEDLQVNDSFDSLSEYYEERRARAKEEAERNIAGLFEEYERGFRSDASKFELLSRYTVWFPDGKYNGVDGRDLYSASTLIRSYVATTAVDLRIHHTYDERSSSFSDPMRTSWSQSFLSEGRVTVGRYRSARGNSFDKVAATVSAPVSAGSLLAEADNSHFDAQAEGVVTDRDLRIKCKFMTLKMDRNSARGVGVDENLIDSAHLIRDAITVGGLPAASELLERVMLEREVRLTPNKPMIARNLRLREAAFRGSQVRLVLAEENDVVGRIKSYELGRDGFVLVHVGDGALKISRSKVRNIVPWSWPDNAVNFLVGSVSDINEPYHG